jgi:peptidoglycan/xylan/chitin deacetylase (PgdA/CDA1 family)
LNRAIHGGKRLLLTVARSLGLFRLARWLTRDGFVIIGWHGVSVDSEHKRMPSYFISPEQLEKRLAFLRRYYHIVSLGEIMAQRTTGRLHTRQAVLTFDDGLRNFLVAAKPILDKFEVPAILYVMSKSAEHQQQSFTFLVRDLFLQSPQQEFWVCDGDGKIRVSLADRKARESAAMIALEKLESLGENDGAKQEYVSALADELHVDLDKLQAEGTWQYLNAEEMSLLSRNGVEIQAHSHAHLNCVNGISQVYSDTVKCRRLLERLTRCDVVHYCYPSGFWTKEVWPELVRAGIATSVTCNLGPNYLQTPPLALRRFIDDSRVSQIEFEFAVSGLRWLIHRCAHPFRSQVPYEKKSMTQRPTF